VVDNAGSFVDFHYLYLTNPAVAAANDEVTEPVSCTVTPESELACAVRNQDVLQLFVDTLAISTVDQGSGGGVFMMVLLP
jgi:hypothetical protein